MIYLTIKPENTDFWLIDVFEREPSLHAPNTAYSDMITRLVH